ncbi:hypothetical protein [Nibricoccus sp. IMCC34717]|uniref:hypothetical protein n=1 Tax=Nibricoccus sp. IMCC34717 TaxID=3034021 RepID=UPI00384B43F4
MTKKIILGLALLAGTVSYAQQQQPAAEQTYGLLGQRYAQVGFAYTDVNHSQVDAFGTGLVVNAPVSSNVDVSLAYSYQWVEAHSEIDGQSLDLAGTYYLTEGQFKPFGTLSLGYVWPDLGDELTWGAVAGFEYVVNKQVSFQVAGGYDDNFKKHNQGEWKGIVSANFWVTPQVAVSPSVALLEGGSTATAIAVAFKF